MRPQKIFWTGCAAILGVWAVALVAMAVVDAQTVTAEKVLDYVATHGLNGRSEAERARIVDDLAERVNHMSFAEKQKMRATRAGRDFIMQMTDAERMRFIELTLKDGIPQLIAALKKMTPQQLNSTMARARRDFGQLAGEEGLEQINDQQVQQLIGMGMQSLLGNSGSINSVELQTFLEQMQYMFQHPKRR